MKETFKDFDTVSLQREVLAARLIPPHKNIVQAFEVHFTSATQQMSLVFEYMNYGSLHDLVEKHIGESKWMPECIIQSVLHQTLRGLEHCHGLGSWIHASRSKAGKYSAPYLCW
jgi:serine/threonine protein kinase